MISDHQVNILADTRRRSSRRSARRRHTAPGQSIGESEEEGMEGGTAAIGHGRAQTRRWLVIQPAR